MINVAIAIIAIISTATLVEHKVELNENQLLKLEKEQGKVNEATLDVLDAHGDALVELRTKADLAITATDVANGFVSKELFDMYQGHMDDRFDGVDSNIDKVLDKLRRAL